MDSNHKFDISSIKKTMYCKRLYMLFKTFIVVHIYNLLLIPAQQRSEDAVSKSQNLAEMSLIIETLGVSVN